jgi:hypothetical protein
MTVTGTAARRIQNRDTEGIPTRVSERTATRPGTSTQVSSPSQGGFPASLGAALRPRQGNEPQAHIFLRSLPIPARRYSAIPIRDQPRRSILIVWLVAGLVAPRHGRRRGRTGRIHHRHDPSPHSGRELMPSLDDQQEVGGVRGEAVRQMCGNGMPSVPQVFCLICTCGRRRSVC